VERLCFKPSGEDVEFGGVFAAGGWFDVSDRLEILFQHVEQFALGATLEHLAQEYTVRRQHVTREMGGGLGQSHNAQMVGAGVADCGGCHVGQDNVGFAIAQQRLEFRLGLLVHEVHFEDFDSGQRLDTQVIDCDDLSDRSSFDRVGIVARVHTRGGNLTPTTGCRAQINHASAGFQKAVFVVDFGELIGGA